MKNCNLRNVSAHIQKKRKKTQKKEHIQFFSGLSLTLSALRFADSGAHCRVPKWVERAENNAVLKNIRWSFLVLTLNSSYSLRYDCLKLRFFNVNFSKHYRAEWVKEDYIHLALWNFNLEKANGLDDILIRVIQLCGKAIVEPLRILFLSSGRLEEKERSTGSQRRT